MASCKINMISLFQLFYLNNLGDFYILYMMIYKILILLMIYARIGIQKTAIILSIKYLQHIKIIN